MKSCTNTKCESGGVKLPPSDFHKSKYSLDGMRSWCKHCTNAMSKRYHLTHRLQIKKRKTKYDKNYRLKNQNKINARNQLYWTKHHKSGHAIELLGCTVDKFKKYIELKFQPGMTWNNWGNGPNRWNIDHIIAVTKFDMSSPKDQQTCFRYTNMQPLWWIDNMHKGNK